jgi:hypothetical protein
LILENQQGAHFNANVFVGSSANVFTGSPEARAAFARANWFVEARTPVGPRSAPRGR